ncbi:MAG: leucine-rich repeat domain-containing protein [Bacteroidales bacterium]|nr:leucine-rich repeat domain-containing protein [Bacteroidales bacterium]
MTNPTVSGDTAATNANKNKISNSYCADGTELLVLPETVDVDGVAYTLTKIGDYSAYGCTNIKTVVIPTTVTEIRPSSFSDCIALEKIIGWDNVTTIGIYAFCYTKLGPDLVLPSPLVTLGAWAFIGCTEVKSVSIAASLKTINSSAFASCTNLEAVTIEENSMLETIGSSAFASCENLTSFSFPASVQRIRNNAFDKCFKMKTLTFEEGSALTAIEKYAFQHCDEVEEILLPKTLQEIGQGVFHDCHKLDEIDIEEGNTFYASVDGVLFNGDKTELIECPEGKMGDYVVPGSVTKIWADAFRFGQLSNVVIPGTVAEIGSMAFAHGYELQTVTFLGENPPTCLPGGAGKPFSNLNSSNQKYSVSLLIPCDYKDNYTDDWKQSTGFNTIRITPQTVSLGDIYSDTKIEDCDCYDFPSDITIHSLGSLSFDEYTSENISKLSTSTIKIEKQIPVNRWSLMGNINSLSSSSTTYSFLNNNVGDATALAHELVALPYFYGTDEDGNNSWQLNSEETYAGADDATPTGFGSFLVWPLDEAMGSSSEDVSRDTAVTVTQTISGADLSENKTSVSFAGVTNEVASSPYWFALSNPYIGRLNLNAFYNANTGKIAGTTAYVWLSQSGTDGDWESVNMESDNISLYPAAGFFVEGTTSSPTFDFTTDCITKEAKSTDFNYKSQAQDVRMEFAVLTSDGVVKKMYSKLDASSSDGYDFKDSHIMFSYNEDAVNPYFSVDNHKLVDNRFNSLPYTSDISFNAYKDKTVEFSLTKPAKSVEVELIDLSAQTYTVLNENEPVIINLNEGTNADRYQLRFSKKNVGIEEISSSDSDILIKNINNEIRLSASELQRAEIYNSIGQLVYSTSLSSNEAVITAKLNQGVYIVKVYSLNRVKSQKIVIE